MFLKREESGRRLGFEPDSASLRLRSRFSVRMQIKKPTTRKKKQQEFAPSYELPTGKDGAMIRT